MNNEEENRLKGLQKSKLQEDKIQRVEQELEK